MTRAMAQEAVPAARPVVEVKPVTFARQVRSEWHKMWALRSTWLIVAIVVVVMALFSSLLAHFAFDPNSVDPQREMVPVDALTRGVSFATVALASFACMLITGEYSSGLIRATLTAQPRRGVVFAAKAAVAVAFAIIIAVLCDVISYFMSMPFFRSPYSVSLSQWSDFRPLLGVALFLPVWALLSLSVGVLLRSTAGAISALLCWVLVVENLIGGIPWHFLQHDIHPYLPGQTSGLIYMSDPLRVATGEGMVMNNVWAAYGISWVWVVVVVSAAVVVFRRRDV
ncbi:MAG: hypothetical protein FWD74_09005 [Actinomycetia bacterium]|nr:hypothetical protein [Actinomycetes bacterium]